MGRREVSTARARGSIDELPSGALRVRVYAGVDPVTKRRHTLTEIVPAGPGADRRARAARDRLISQIEERRNPRTNATVNQLLERYLEQLDAAPRTKELYRGYVRKHIAPLIGSQKVSAVDAEILDSFYTELRRCRDHCTGRPKLKHRTTGKHRCDDRCRIHSCEPLGPTTVRHVHFILSGAYKRAVRWKWVATNPCSQAEPPAAPTPNPRPPSVDDAARLLDAAWRDPDWGTLVWVGMTSGARRGELCALRWRDVDLAPGREVLWLRCAISHSDAGWREGDLKTHQQRRVALDPETVAILVDHRARCAARAATLDLGFGEDTFVFSSEPAGSRFLAPSSLTQRYDRLAARLGIDTTFHKLRHYSATELIAAGVDVRTVAGRLGHGGGGTTTLKAYAAWVSEADQRAAKNIGGRMPERPVELDANERAKSEPRSPYEKIAAALRAAIGAGAIPVGEPIPTVAELAARHGVASATAQRAVSLLKAWGLVDAARGRRARVISAGTISESVSGHLSASGDILPEADGERSVAGGGEDAMAAPRLWAITVRGPDGHRYPPRRVTEDIDQPDSFRPHLLAIARMEAPQHTDSGENWIGDFELEVREPGKEHQDPELTLRWQKP